MQIDPLTKEIPDEFLQKLGALVVSWAVIDKLISHLFIGMTDGEPGSMYVITENISSNTISEWITTLLEARTIDDRVLGEEIKEFFVDIKEPRITRNTLVHGVWNPREAEEGSLIVQTVRLERAEFVKGELVTLSDLNNHIEEAQELAMRLHRLMERFGCAITDP